MRSLRATVTAASAVILGVVLLTVGHGMHGVVRASGAQPAAPALGPGGPSFTPGGQRSAPHLTTKQAQAIASAEFGSWILRRKLAATYGSFTDDRYSRMTAIGKRPVGTIDAWQITVTGLSIPRPCPSGTTCPPVQTLSVFVDDKAGSYVEAVGT